MAAKDEPIVDVLKKAAGGRADVIRGDGTITGDFLSGARLDAAVLQNASLTTSYRIPCVANDAVAVLLKASTITGTVTATLSATLSDGVTADTTTSASLSVAAAATAYKVSLSGLGGCAFARLDITTAAASTAQFLAASGYAEYRCL